jgi:hypothetical protein
MKFTYLARLIGAASLVGIAQSAPTPGLMGLDSVLKAPGVSKVNAFAVNQAWNEEILYSGQDHQVPGCEVRDY